MARKKPRRRKPGTGTIRVKRGREKPYETAFPLGRGQYRYAAFATLAEATAHLNALTRERDDTFNPRDIAGGAMSLHQFLTLWLSIKKPHIKRKTYANYRYHCAVAVEYMGGSRRIDGITRKDADVLYITLHERGFHSGAQLRAVLAQAWDYAEEESYVRGNPFKRAKAPPTTRRQNIALSNGQRDRLLTVAADDALAPLWHLYSRLAFRRGEGLGLLWANIDWQKQTVKITQQWTNEGAEMYKETPKTKRATRVVPCPPDILDLLRQLQTAQRKRAAADPSWVVTGYVFTDDHGRPISANDLWARWRILRRRAGMPEGLTIHDLRHTALTLLEQAGTPLSIVQAFAGHTSATMTAHYTDHADVETMRRALG